jgi:ribosomal protein S18 acetylase RimI-like enzyme
MSVDQGEGIWRQTLEQGAPDTWVIEEHDAVLGWMTAGSSRDPGSRSSTSELWAIYVDPKHWRRGVGQRLWSEIEDQLRRSGFSDVTLWVLQDNAGALAFYSSNGFAADGIEKTIEIGGTELVEIRLRKALGG